MATVKVNVLFKLWFIVFMSRTFVYMRSLPRIGYIMPYMHISFNTSYPIPFDEVFCYDKLSIINDITVLEKIFCG